MAEWELLIPRPESQFLRVKCNNCESEETVFSHANTKVFCKVCGTLLAEPTGGKAKIHGKVVAILG